MDQDQPTVAESFDALPETPMADLAPAASEAAAAATTAEPEPALAQAATAPPVLVLPKVDATGTVEPARLYDENGNLIERAWYIVQTFSGQEYNVRLRIEAMVKTKNYADRIFKILVPEEQVVEVKDNRRLEKVQKMYPGYVFVECLLDDTVWYEVRRIAGVAKFVGYGNRPTPVVEKDMLRVLRQMGEKGKKVEVDMEVGETVKVINGPFRGYTGAIVEVNPERGKVKTKLSIFGRETPVELDFNQVEKVSSL